MTQANLMFDMHRVIATASGPGAKAMRWAQVTRGRVVSKGFNGFSQNQEARCVIHPLSLEPFRRNVFESSIPLEIENGLVRLPLVCGLDWRLGSLSPSSRHKWTPELW